MDRCLIYDNQRQPGDPQAQVVKTSSDYFRIDGDLLKDERMKIMLSVEEGENIDSVARRSRDFNRFADCLPGLRHTRIER